MHNNINNTALVWYHVDMGILVEIKLSMYHRSEVRHVNQELIGSIGED